MRKPTAAQPKLTAAARAILKAKIRVHPDAASHVKSSFEVSKLKKAQLLSIARKLGIDIDAVIKQAELNPKAMGVEVELQAEKTEGYAFSGEIEFDLEISMLGTGFQRKGRITYQHTPEWNYLSPVTGKERLGSGSSTFKMEIMAILEREAWESQSGRVVKRKNNPYWTEVGELLQDGVLPESLMDTIFDMIDDDARRQDAINRARVQVQ